MFPLYRQDERHFDSVDRYSTERLAIEEPFGGHGGLERDREALPHPYHYSRARRSVCTDAALARDD